MGKDFNPSLKRYIYADFFAISQKEWPVCSVFCFAGSCKEVNRRIIKKPTYCQLLTSFRRSNGMFVDVFIECVAWSYWWTGCDLPIICNSEHFSFFIFYFNVSNKISSTPPLLLKFQFSSPLFISVYYWWFELPGAYCNIAYDYHTKYPTISKIYILSFCK